MNQDSIQTFIFDNHPIRGVIVRLDDTYRSVVGQQAYPPMLKQLMGEALLSVGLISAISKHEGKLTLQFQGQGALKLLSVRCTHDYTLRGFAQWEGELAAETSLKQALSQGILALTYEPENFKERYQSLVEVQGQSVAEAMEAYVNQSEQTQAKFYLASSERSVVGILLQTLPGTEEEQRNSFEYVAHLAHTLSSQEMLTLSNEALLYRLFHQDEVRLFEAKSIRFGCSCSLARMENAVLGLGYEDAKAILTQYPAIEVTCEFCHKHYQFDPYEVDEMFRKHVASHPGVKH